MRRFLYLFMMMSFMLLTLPVLAKGSASRIDVSGPELSDTVVLTDPAVLESLSIARLEDFVSGSIEVPFVDPQKHTYYELSRYTEVSNGQSILWDTVRYYPDPNGERGYVHYVGMENGWSEYDNHWFRVRDEGEAAMQRLLDRQSKTVWERLSNQFAQFVANVMPEARLISLTTQDFTSFP